MLRAGRYPDYADDRRAVTPRFNSPPTEPYERASGSYRTVNDPADAGMPIGLSFR
jgi:hypothetical protein